MKKLKITNARYISGTSGKVSLWSSGDGKITFRRPWSHEYITENSIELKEGELVDLETLIKSYREVQEL